MFYLDGSIELLIWRLLQDSGIWLPLLLTLL